MALKVSWNGIVFQSTETERSLVGKVKLSVERETEDKEDGGQKYVESKNGKPVEIEMTAILHACFGVNVHDWIMNLLHAAQRKGADYLYIGGSKLFPFKVMLTKADTEEIKFSPSGAWVSTNVGLTFKQASKEPIIPDPPQPPVTSSDGGSSGGGSSGGGSSKSKPKKPSPPKKEDPPIDWGYYYMSGNKRPYKKK